MERNGKDEGRLIVRRERKRIAPKLDAVQLFGLHAGDKGALQGLGHEGILFRLEITLRSLGTFAGFIDCGQVDKSVPVAFDKFLQEASNFGLGSGVFDVVNEAR